MISSTWYKHIGVFPQAWTWTVVNESIPGGGGNFDSPTITPAALVNPNRETYPTQEPAVGHMLYCMFHVTGGTVTAYYQFRIPTGSNTWHTFATSAAVAGFIVRDAAFEALYIPCVPQMRVRFTNSGAGAGVLEGALTLYTA